MYLVASGHVVRHVFEAAHHPVVPEVVRKRLRPLGQQLHQLGRHFAETDLKTPQGIKVSTAVWFFPPVQFRPDVRLPPCPAGRLRTAAAPRTGGRPSS